MKCIEYEFTRPDGTKRYEIVDPEAGYSVMHQINLFMKSHGAISTRPVEPTLSETKNDERSTSERNVASPI